MLPPNPRLFFGLHRVLYLVFLCLPLSGTCHAQDDPRPTPATFALGGQWTQPAGVEHSSLQSGWKNFQAQGGIAITGEPATRRPVQAFIIATFLFEKLDAQPQAVREAQDLNTTDLGLFQANAAKARFYSATLDLTIRFPTHLYKKGQYSGDFYIFGGPGWLRRDLDFTSASGEGNLLQPSSPSVFGTGGNSAAFDAGFGFNIRLGHWARGWMPFVEARVLHGLAVNHETTLLPVSLGARW